MVAVSLVCSLRSPRRPGAPPSIGAAREGRRDERGVRREARRPPGAGEREVRREAGRPPGAVEDFVRLVRPRRQQDPWEPRERGHPEGDLPRGGGLSEGGRVVGRSDARSRAAISTAWRAWIIGCAALQIDQPIKRDMTEPEFKSRYKKGAIRTHPDKNPGRTRALEPITLRWFVCHDFSIEIHDSDAMRFRRNGRSIFRVHRYYTINADWESHN